MSCDTCGKVTANLEQIRDLYKTELVVMVCPECIKIVNEQLAKLQQITVNVQVSWLKRFINNLRVTNCNREAKQIGSVQTWGDGGYRD